MPELPEVEVTRRGLAPAIVGRSVTAVNVRTPKLREPLQDLAALLPGLTLEHLERRAKYLIWTFRSAAGEKRWLLTHMGMSGSWRIWSLPAPSAHKHDHADIVFGDVLGSLYGSKTFRIHSIYDDGPEKVASLDETWL